MLKIMHDVEFLIEPRTTNGRGAGFNEMAEELTSDTRPGGGGGGRESESTKA